MSTSQRTVAMVAAQASLQAMYPTRHVLRGTQDFAALGDAVLQQGVIALIAEGTKGWTEYAGGEARNGTLAFAAVLYLKVDAPDATAPEAVEDAEAVIEQEVLDWCAAIKPAPLDAVYPRAAQYSRGLDAPYGWVVMELEALYV